jgi:hypothetical protein
MICRHVRSPVGPVSEPTDRQGAAQFGCPGRSATAAVYETAAVASNQRLQRAKQSQKTVENSQRVGRAARDIEVDGQQLFEAVGNLRMAAEQAA